MHRGFKSPERKLVEIMGSSSPNEQLSSPASPADHRHGQTSHERHIKWTKTQGLSPLNENKIRGLSPLKTRTWANKAYKDDKEIITNKIPKLAPVELQPVANTNTWLISRSTEREAQRGEHRTDGLASYTGLCWLHHYQTQDYHGMNPHTKERNITECMRIHLEENRIERSIKHTHKR